MLAELEMDGRGADQSRERIGWVMAKGSREFLENQ